MDSGTRPTSEAVHRVTFSLSCEVVMRRTALILTVGCVTLAVAACGPVGNADAPTPAAAPAGAYQKYDRAGGGAGGAAAPKDESPGQVVFKGQCAKCHSVGEAVAGGPPAGGPGGPKAPSLAKIGAKHDKAAIMEFVREPKAHNPMSKMPAFPEDKLSKKDLEALADYLSALK